MALYINFIKCISLWLNLSLSSIKCQSHLSCNDGFWIIFFVLGITCPCRASSAKWACVASLCCLLMFLQQLLGTLKVVAIMSGQPKQLWASNLHPVEPEAPEIVPLDSRTCLYNTHYNHSKQLSSLYGHIHQYLNSCFPSTINLFERNINLISLAMIYPIRWLYGVFME